MSNYFVKHTDFSIPPISISEDSIDRSTLGVSLVGRIYQGYGEDINENLVNILENFSCPEDASATSEFDATPDLTQTSKTQLDKPVVGQLWFNSTRRLIYTYDGASWNPIPSRSLYAANWGQIAHGEQLPKPINQQGYVFDYPECIWSVSPADIFGNIDSLMCSTDTSANVTAQVRRSGYANLENIIANYLIIGIRGNVNGGGVLPPPIVVSPTPTPGASNTPTPTSSAIPPTATNTPTPSTTNTPTPTISNTPIPPTPGVSHTPQPTPAVTPTRTGTPAGTPASTPASTPAVTPTRTGTPAGTPASTPAVTVTPTPTVSPSGLPPLPFCPCPTMYQSAVHGGFVYNSVGPYSTYAAALAAKAPDQEIWSNDVSCYWLLPINQGDWVLVVECSQM